MCGRAGSESTSTDAVLIGQSVVDPESFTLIVERHATPVFRYLASRVDRSVAEDLLSDVFHAAFKSRRRYDQRHDNALPWLLGIATNMIRHHRRSEVRHSSMVRRMVQLQVSRNDLTAAADAVAAGVEQRDDLQRVRRALDSLDDKHREVVVLSAGLGLSYEDIARTLGIKVGTVRSRLSRGRARLRELLGTDGQYREYPEPVQGYHIGEERPK
ncbi:MAG TPA: RNA polymerase sigma factor [Acidimicrobiales bacterium]|nr:RNA polymerase sigma factor [Acidimicrobiales bacterium]